MRLLGHHVTYPSFANDHFKFFSAGFDLGVGSDLVRALNAANINLLRRHAPYAYLFACDEYQTVEEWRQADIGDEMGEGVTYRQKLDSTLLSPGLWLQDPSADFQGNTVITAILQGDVLPFVHLLAYEEFAMLCLPEPYSLSQITQVIGEAPHHIAAVQQLLSKGGFVVAILDDNPFKIYTLDESYRAYFEPSA